MAKKLKRALALALATGMSACATAALVPINNAGFEDPVLADGQQNGGGYAVPGWAEFDEQHAWAFDIFNPDAGTIPAGALGGQNVLMSMAYRPATQYVEQQLGATLQPNTRYTLSAWVADPDAKSPLNNVRLMLYAGTSLLGSTNVQPAAPGVWTNGILVLNTGNSHPETGRSLKVRLMWGDHASYRVLVDDVALDATSLATNVPAAPVKFRAAAFGATAIDLTWRPGDAAANGYQVERALGGGPFATIATLPADATAYRDLFLPASAAISYRLSAFNDLGNSPLATAMSATMAGDAGAFPGPAFANVRDYGYLWWQNGLNDPVYRLKTSRYAMSFHAATLGPTALFPLIIPPSESAALVESSAAGFPPSPPVALNCRVVADGATNAVTATSSPIRDAQLVECGKFFQRRWHKVNLLGGPAVNLYQSGLEVAAWPDRLSFVLRLTPTNNVSNGVMEMTLSLTNAYATLLTNGAGSALQAADGTGFVFLKSAGSGSLAVDPVNGLVTVRTAVTNWLAGKEYSVGLIVYPVAANVTGALSSAVAAETSPLLVTATEIVPALRNLVTSYDPDRGWHQVSLRNDGAVGDNGMVRTRLSVTNDSSSPRVLRLNLNGVLFYIPGLTAVLRDEQLNPLGIPVQLSKNWHTSIPAERFQGEWFHGLTMLTVPPETGLNFEVAIVGQNWGGMPAATHSQLSVIGYFGQGASQWDEAALGSYGEALCYDPDHGLTDNDCTDSRPMLMLNAQGNPGGWCINAGGGSFLRCFGVGGTQIRHSQMRTRYARYGPNLADALYAGRSTDGALSFTYSAGLFRSDDYTRGLHRIRMEVTADTSFSRLAFYQQAGDTYAYNQGRTLAYGNAASLAPLRQWAATVDQNRYIGAPVALTGPMPWAATLDAPAEAGYTAANHGFILRSWKARLNGSNNVPPYLAERSVAGASIFDLVPPPGVTTLKAGDYVEAEIVRFYVPKLATNYYGPNAHFRLALTNYQNTHRLALREAVGNNLSVDVQTGTLVQLFPAQIQVTNNQATFSVTGGLGAVPFTFSGLSDYRAPLLEEQVGGVWTPLDQAVHGQDFWQCDYDAEAGAWTITFTLKLDGTNYQTIESLMSSPQTRSFRFRLAAATTAPRFLSIIALPDGNVSFTISGNIGQSYALLLGTNVTQPINHWSVLSTGMVSETPFMLQDLTASNALHRFYSLRIL